MIHGDFNETNIIVDETNVSGILDFGDSSYSYYVFEVAICALYMMLDAVKNDCTFNQIEIAAHVIAGKSIIINFVVVFINYFK
jgi:hydroxylysine kinase